MMTVETIRELVGKLEQAEDVATFNVLWNSAQATLEFADYNTYFGKKRSDYENVNLLWFLASRATIAPAPFVSICQSFANKLTLHHFRVKPINGNHKGIPALYFMAAIAVQGNYQPLLSLCTKFKHAITVDDLNYRYSNAELSMKDLLVKAHQVTKHDFMGIIYPPKPKSPIKTKTQAPKRPVLSGSASRQFRNGKRAVAAKA